jgi:hypothetical protein
MSRFVEPHDQLDTRDLPDGRVQLLAPLWYQSDLLGGRIVKLREGFVHDKESVPWWLPITYVWLAVKRKASRAGSVHDWLYAVQKVEDLEVPQELADAVYHEAAAFDGNGRVVRWVKWAGVRIGGARSYKSGPTRFQVNGNDRRRRQDPCPVDRRTAAPMPRQLEEPEAP